MSLQTTIIALAREVSYQDLGRFMNVQQLLQSTLSFLFADVEMLSTYILVYDMSLLSKANGLLSRSRD